MTLYPLSQDRAGIPHDLFSSPEFLPLNGDFQRGSFLFIRMSRGEYEKSITLGNNLLRAHAHTSREFRVDDLLLASTHGPGTVKTAHFILHTAFCCSSLLARYLELLPSCFVLKEPQLLAEFADVPDQSTERWADFLRLGIRLLSRTYSQNEVPIIKAHVPTNAFGNKLLEYSPESVVIFLKVSLKSFLLATLKSESRRQRVRHWVNILISHVRTDPSFSRIEPEKMTDSQVAACFWLMNRLFYAQIATGPYSHRVRLVDGDDLSDHPKRALPSILEFCGLRVNEEQLKSLLEHPTIHLHAKDRFRTYDAASRRRELAGLDVTWGREADEGINWASSRGIMAEF